MLTDSIRKAIDAQIKFIDELVPDGKQWEAHKRMSKLMDLWTDVGCELHTHHDDD